MLNRRNPPSPARRYARTPENVLTALGCYPSREMRAKLRLWQGFPDFPAKTRHGYDIEALLEWAENNAALLVKRAKLGKILQDGENVSSVDMRLFRAAGVPTFRVNDEEFPEVAHGMDELGALIMRRFRDYPQLGEVGRQRIHAWKRLAGVARRPGLVPFPAPTARNDYRVVDAFQWVAAWILPDLPRNVGDLLGDNVDWDRKLKKIEFENKEIEQAQLRGKLMLKAEHNRALEAIGKAYADQLWALFDEQAYESFGDLLTRAGVPEQWRAVALAQLRTLNPGLLRAHQAHLAELAAGAREVVEDDPAARPDPAGLLFPNPTT